MELPTPDRAPDLWAKSALPGQARGQTLLEHTWEVLCRLRDLAALRPALPRQAGLLRLWLVLFWATCLHDFGKAATGFQAMLRRRARRWPYRHEVLSLAFLDWIAQHFTGEERLLLAAAIATHHRDFSELSDYLDPWDEDSDPLPDMLADLPGESALALYDVLAHDLPHWIMALNLAPLGVTPLSLPPREQALTLLSVDRVRAHLRAVDERLRTWEEAQYQQQLDPAILRPALLLRGLLVQSDHLGSAGFGPLPYPTWDADTLLHTLGLGYARLYPHQQAAARCEGHAWLTAPTGSGKTEAALLWAARQAPPRLFYTLPYQASMNAMYDRLRALFGDERVGLLHGRSTLALYQRLMTQDGAPEDAARRARMLRNRAGLSWYPVRVLSPYQMLKAAFQVKGFEALLSDFTQAAFVFDEIHAYEPNRLAMILETVRYLAHHFGARFLVMSATLPAEVRQRWREAVGQASAIQADAATCRRFRRHRLRLLDGDLLDEANLERILHAVCSEGHQVLVVCNTVRRARAAWQWLAPRLPAEMPIFLLHSRFTGADRVHKERAILHAAGLGAQHRPLLVVATQVVEVSLNLDLDVLYTDPAPLEALFQRFGRVNRLGKRPPAPVHVFRQVDEVFRFVYAPLEQVTRSLTVLEEVTRHAPPEGHPIDEARLQDWLDALYTNEVLAAWQKRFEQARIEFREQILDRLLPWQSDQNAQEAFERLFDGVEVLPEALYETYLARREQEPMTAAHLLVPISYGQAARLKEQGLWCPSDGDLPPIVRVPYHADSGLALP